MEGVLRSTVLTSCWCTAIRRPRPRRPSPPSTPRSRLDRVEAGLHGATTDEPFPEELNRRITGAIAGAITCADRGSKGELARRTPRRRASDRHGNTVIDAFLDTTAAARGSAAAPAALAGLDPHRPLIFVTAHRRENHDAMAGHRAGRPGDRVAFPQRPQIFLAACTPSPQVAPVIRPILSGRRGDTTDRTARLCLDSGRRDPGASSVLTDSGGLQEEAPTLGQAGPGWCAVRPSWPEGLAAGTFRPTAPTRPRSWTWSRRLLEDYRRRLQRRWPGSLESYGHDGHAAERDRGLRLLWPLRPGSRAG